MATSNSQNHSSKNQVSVLSLIHKVAFTVRLQANYSATPIGTMASAIVFENQITMVSRDAGLFFHHNSFLPLLNPSANWHGATYLVHQATITRTSKLRIIVSTVNSFEVVWHHKMWYSLLSRALRYQFLLQMLRHLLFALLPLLFFDGLLVRQFFVLVHMFFTPTRALIK